MKLIPIRNNIIFKFLDEIDSRGQFVQKTKTGMVITSHHEDSAKAPRWVKVINVGPECETIKIGDKILLPALRWTPHFTYEGEKLWKTDESEVVAYTGNFLSDVDMALYMLKKYVAFEREDTRINRTASGIIVVGPTPDTPTGIVRYLGRDVDRILHQSRIYFSDVNFFNKFSFNNKTYWFIEQDDILVYEPLDQKE